MPSRRDFLANLAQAGVALSALRLPQYPPVFGSRAHSPQAPAPNPQDWRMLGLFRGGSCDAVSGVPGRLDEFYFGHVNGGVWKTIDAGRTWFPIFDDQPVASIGALAVAPSAPDVIYVGSGESTLRDSVGFGNGVYKSTDAGRSWTHLGLGDTQHIGKIAVDPKNPDVVFVAAIGKLYTANPERGVFRSDDGGATWQRVSADQALWGRGWYFEKIAVDPRDPDIVYVPNVAVNRSRDGGATWDVIRGSPGGDDYHQIWISAENPNILIVASDQGTIITRNARTADPPAMTWSSWLNQPTAQIYHASVDYRFPYWVVGAQQDSGAVAVRSRGKFAQSSQRDWEPIGAAGESGYATGDPLHPGIIYGDDRSRWVLESNPPGPSTSAPKGTETDRGDWTQPLVLSPADPHALYYASQFLFKTTDGARTWKQISGDLTRPDPGIPPNLDATAAAATDRNGKRGVIYGVAPSPLRAPLIWTRTAARLVTAPMSTGTT